MKKTTTAKRFKIIFGAILCVIVLSIGLFLLVGCEWFATGHDYNISFSGQNLGTVRIGDEFNMRIHSADFTPSREGQRITYRLDGTLPLGLSLCQNTGYITGAIRPDSTRTITLGVNTFRISAVVYGSNAYLAHYFTIDVGGGEFGEPGYEFNISFEEDFIRSETLNVRIEAGGDVDTNHFVRTPLQLRFGDNEWQSFPPFNITFGYGKNISLPRGELTQVQIRYAPINNQMMPGTPISLAVDTRPQTHESYFFNIENGTLIGFSDFFIAYYSGCFITLPPGITAVSWQALSTLIWDTVSISPEPRMPRFNSITVPASVTHIVGELSPNGIHYRQVIIFEGVTPPSFSNPLPSSVPVRFMRGGRFIAPDASLNAYRSALPDFTQRILGLHASYRNVFGHSSIADNYFIVYEQITAGPRRYALITYFGSSPLAIVPTRVNAILPHAFYGANHIEELVLPNALNTVYANAFVLNNSISTLENVFFEGVRTEWDAGSGQREGFPEVTVLFLADPATEAGQWRWIGEQGYRTPLAW